MLRTDADPPAFESGSLVPVATYLLVISVLSGLLFVAPGASPPPLLGMAWGVFLVALVIGALGVEGVSARTILPSARTLLAAVGSVVVFWTLYNLVAAVLATAGVHGFETTLSRVAANPMLYLAALLSSLVFTAIPEEFLFRTYLQQKLTALAGGGTRRAVGSGLVVVAVLFALFHLPRWFIGMEHGIGAALGSRLLTLTLMGVAYGVVYALTRNLWLVALFHATMNQPPLLITVDVPSEMHFAVGLVEYVAIVAIVYLTTRVTESEPSVPVWTRTETGSATSDQPRTARS
ncbi:CPBP family glutamic-type intramembrane protease [Halobellus sp. EA9]|uniref:CPBP family glutamic-type intramembrane protease n=1 Tax=Halobellus sp. EA9 TaxID=3421647 RepID=UPI003EB9906C